MNLVMHFCYDHIRIDRLKVRPDWYRACQKSKDLSVGGAEKNSEKNIFFTSMNFDVMATISLLVKS